MTITAQNARPVRPSFSQRVSPETRGAVDFATDSRDLLDAMQPGQLQALESIMTRSHLKGVGRRERLSECLQKQAVEISGAALGSFQGQVLRLSLGENSQVRAELNGRPVSVLDASLGKDSSSLDLTLPDGSYLGLSQHKDHYLNVKISDQAKNVELSTSFMGDRVTSASAEVAAPTGAAGMVLYDDGISAVMYATQQKPGTPVQLSPGFVGRDDVSRICASEDGIRVDQYGNDEKGFRLGERPANVEERWQLLAGMTALNEKLLTSYPNLGAS